MLLIFKKELLNIMNSLLVSVANPISQMIALKQLA